jgi:hypothetical protein
MTAGASMPLALFYRGLLYALAERRSSFVADGDAFHAAFKHMLEAAQAKGLPVPAEDLLDQFDPVFGLSPHAAEMLFEGERDFILSLMNPRLVTASFKISKEDAREALARLNAAETFRVLATDLDGQLVSPM